MEIRKNGGNVVGLRAKENMMAEIADQNAKIDYLAMMTDVDFPEENPEINFENKESEVI